MGIVDPYIEPTQKHFKTQCLRNQPSPANTSASFIYGNSPTEVRREDYLLKSFVSRLSGPQKTILLASSTNPKTWSSILRHAKVTPLPRVTKGAIYDRHWFSMQDMDLLYQFVENPSSRGKYKLSTAGRIVRNYIKMGLDRG